MNVKPYNPFSEEPTPVPEVEDLVIGTPQMAGILAANLDGLCVWIRLDGQPDKLVQVDSIAMNGDSIQLEVDGSDA